MKPLKVEELVDRQVANLSGGELQRVELCVCLGKVRFKNTKLLKHAVV
jgi:ATP-binding cassette subfamily E protein 1